MRISDTNRAGYAQLHYSKQASISKSNKGAESQDSVDTSEHTKKIEKLKAMIQSGQPIDVNHLASAMIRQGVLFDEKA